MGSMEQIHRVLDGFENDIVYKFFWSSDIDLPSLRWCGMVTYAVRNVEDSTDLLLCKKIPTGFLLWTYIYIVNGVELFSKLQSLKAGSTVFTTCFATVF